MLNYILDLPKTIGNFNSPPTFVSILLDAIRDKPQLEYLSLTKHGKFSDRLSVNVNGKLKTLIIGGHHSANKIITNLLGY